MRLTGGLLSGQRAWSPDKEQPPADTEGVRRLPRLGKELCVGVACHRVSGRPGACRSRRGSGSPVVSVPQGWGVALGWDLHGGALNGPRGAWLGEAHLTSDTLWTLP